MGRGRVIVTVMDEKLLEVVCFLMDCVAGETDSSSTPISNTGFSRCC